MTQTYMLVNNILYSICLTLYFFFYIIVTHRHFASESGFAFEQRSLICRCVCSCSACGIIRINPFFWDLSSSYTYIRTTSIFEFFAFVPRQSVRDTHRNNVCVWRNVKELNKFMKVGCEVVAWEISHLLIATVQKYSTQTHLHHQLWTFFSLYLYFYLYLSYKMCWVCLFSAIFYNDKILCFGCIHIHTHTHTCVYDVTYPYYIYSTRILFIVVAWPKSEDCEGCLL